MTDAAPPLLQVRNLRTEFQTDAGPIRAVEGVSFDMRPGETVGIVGESGSGKSVTALSILRLLADNARIAEGSISFRGQDLATLSEEEIRRLRGGEISMIFQDPLTSLNPVLRISRQLVEGMLAHGRLNQVEALKHGIDLLARMGINAPERAVNGYPHEFSGGMRQRVMLAMGFANNPSLLIADEPTTALDVTIQAQILDLLKALNREFGTAVLLISHDLGVIASVCERVLVMYAGEVVEEGPTEDLLADPRHPYTWALLNAVPRLDREPPADKRLTAIEGVPPDSSKPMAGCRFRVRCPFAIERCTEHPDLLPVAEGRRARCWVTQGGERLLKPAAAAATAAASLTEAGRPMLELRGVVKHYPLRRDALFSTKKVVRAVDGIDLDIRRGETVGLVGESGSGKSTIARLITRIQKPTSGSIRFGEVDLATADRRVLRPLRRRIQMIFQDPYASLNPRMTVGQILAEPLRFHRLVRGEAQARVRVGELLDMVGLPVGSAERYPHEFSGGQRQRIGTARALAVEPELIIADEPISALDVNIRAQIINLFVGLQQRLGLTFLFIAHDLAVVRQVSDHIVVLYLGKVMEVAAARDLFAEPLHPYTRSLISAAPIPDAAVERRREHIRLTGEPPSPVNPPSGCRFRTRCPIAQGICAEVEPPLAELRTGHRAACHFPGQM
ncbi:MAG: ABC transporter ATP-binding protein [Alphaproteobacteria bacterium]|nr:ABC transporter ATP-binding protein [Alphaproteobacteria bacterium]